jgi:hypothetical protein
MSSGSHERVSAWLVAAAGWALPGAGYWLIGQRARGVVIGATILVLFLLGVLISGVRVIDVPGYDLAGQRVRANRAGHRITPKSPQWDGSRWILTSGRGVLSEVASKPWFIPQLVTGPITIVTAVASVQAAERGIPRVHARLADIGTLYTAIAGMLNLMAIIDSAHRAAHRED